MFKVVVVPFTVKLPDKVKSAKVGESPVPKSFVFTFTPFILICPWASPSADADTIALPVAVRILLPSIAATPEDTLVMVVSEAWPKFIDANWGVSSVPKPFEFTITT